MKYLIIIFALLLSGCVSQFMSQPLTITGVVKLDDGSCMINVTSGKGTTFSVTGRDCDHVIGETWLNNNK